MSLMLQGAAVVVPAPAGGTAVSPKELFDNLCNDFGVDLKVAAYLVDDCGLESLEDFLHFFTAEEQIESRVIDKVRDLPHAFRNAARLRRAWAGVKGAASAAEESKKKGKEDPDLDTLLPEAELTDLRDRFWERYKLNFGVLVEPSDYLVSRLHKEMAKRLLQVPPVFKTKSLTHQLRAERKRKRISDELELVTTEQEGDENVHEDLKNYISLHYTLMLAYARAGCSKLASAPSAPETRDKDTSD